MVRNTCEVLLDFISLATVWMSKGLTANQGVEDITMVAFMAAHPAAKKEGLLLVF